MAEIEIVQPVAGATQVTFDYGAASRAIDAYSLMARRLSAQYDARVGPRDAAVVSWTGHYRDEFDGAWELLQLRFSGAVEGVSYGMQAIYNAVDDANEMQRIWNRNAEDARNEPPVPAGPTGPRGAY
jgi:hypothetical protein